jgi:alkylated DNA repair dioxygenase AlkB
MFSYFFLLAVSCKFSKPDNEEKIRESTKVLNNYLTSGYESIPFYPWEKSPTLLIIKQLLEEKIGVKFDYCLNQTYLDGKSTIGYHFDREALNTYVVSVSFGAGRDMLFKEISQLKLPKDEQKVTTIHLQSGDVVIMKPGCQRKLFHSIPAQSSVKDLRFSYTFRQNDLSDKARAEDLQAYSQAMESDEQQRQHFKSFVKLKRSKSI